jgi:thiol-disulfide isomerase/thioredoxin
METPQPSPGRFIALLLIGAGLISVAAAIFIFTVKPFGADSTPREFSTVPGEVNYAAPDLTLTDLDGKTVSLKDYRGSVVLVNLWATWCPPCRAEMPTLQAFYEKHKDNGFVVVAIDQEETRDVVAPFVEENGLTFPVWLDLNYEAEKKFNTEALPTSFVIDRNGKVRLMWVGGISQKNLEYYVSYVIYNY